MATAPKKKSAKKSTKKSAKKGDAPKAPKTSPAKKAEAHLKSAHRNVMRCIESVTVDNREDIERVRRALDHAHANTKAR